MLNYIMEEVNEYQASIFAGLGVKRAFVVLYTTNSKIYIYFYNEGEELPENTSPVIRGQQHVLLHSHYNDYPNTIDLLRNEKPIYYFYDYDEKNGYLTTLNEPIGENELGN